MAAVDPATRKRVLRVIFISLLLDLVWCSSDTPQSKPQWRIPCRAPIQLGTAADRVPASQISFTFILPLFPKLLEFYRDREAPELFADGPKTLLQSILGGLNRYKSAFARPIEARYDIVLLGGALGSMFS